MPGVEVTATDTDTGIKRTTVTNGAGEYTLPNLQIGPYRLEASKQGFRTYIQTGIELQVDTGPVIAITLGVGDVSQAVQVEANATQVETQKLGVGTVMETQRILDLPLNGRNPTDLIVLTGAAVRPAPHLPSAWQPASPSPWLAAWIPAFITRWTARLTSTSTTPPECPFLFPMRCRNSR